MKLSAAVVLFIIVSTNIGNALPPGAVEIIGVELIGNGCPEGTARAQLAPDGSSFTILYDAFQVQAGGAAGPLVERECRVKIDIRKPANMMFNIENVDLRGFIQLSAGAKARQMIRVVAGLHGGRQGKTRDFGFEKWKGPIAENYIISAAPLGDSGAVNCRPNQRTMIKVASQVRVRSPQGEGQVSVDSVDGRIAQTYRLSWTLCSGSGNN